MTDTPISDLSKLPWGLRIRELRVRANLTQEALADQSGTTKATISKIERSTKAPSLEWMERLAGPLKVEIGELIGSDLFGKQMPTTLVPVIGLIAAGNWREAIQEPDGFVPVPETRPDAFSLRIQGESVNLIAPDGSYVVIDPHSSRLMDGGVYAVMNDEGETTLKKYRSEPARLEPQSTDPEHQVIELGSKPVTVIGRAFFVIRAI